LKRTSGPILELGSGWFSTPLIAAFSAGRYVRTIESDAGWLRVVALPCVARRFAEGKHDVVYVKDFADAPVEDKHWSVVLVDHEPPPRRGVDLARLADRADLLVAHDSQHEAYGYWPVFERFKYRYDYTRLLPWTTVVSNVDPLDWLEDALRPLW